MRRMLIALLVLVSGCGGGPPEPSNRTAQAAAPAVPEAAGKVDRSHAGKPAPGTEFDDPDGDTVTLASFEGKPLLLNLWATWCGPCVKEMPTLDALAARQGDKLQVVALSQDTSGREKVDAFFSKAKIGKLEAYMDPKLAVMGDLRVEELPTTILFDAQGREIWRVTGELDWQSPKAAALIAEGFRNR
jgi:thiol-disulfide isomerase/thioredoxin